MIRFSNLYKQFGRQKVLKGIDLSFNTPGIYGILGPNGSGKTTLIKCLLGMVLPTKGDIIFSDKSIKKQWAYRDQIDYLPQIARFPDNLRVSELLTLIRQLRNKPSRENELITRLRLDDFMDKKLGNLSGGTRQKINIVQAFMYNSPVIILDEPTSGLDPLAMQTLRQLLIEEREKGKTILITTHIMDFAEAMCDHIIFILEGLIHFRGRLDALKEQYGNAPLEKIIAMILKERLDLNVEPSKDVKHLQTKKEVNL